ncbi:MAG: hypothetical protein ACP5N2_00755 [Candidatus Nanoarchaeia archaeon]
MHLQVTPGPQWFSGPDFIIDLISVVILFMIGFFAWKFYSLNKSNKKHLLLFISLVVLGASFIFKILTYLILYSTTFEVEIFDMFGQLIYYLEPNNFYFSISFIIYAVLTLIGFYLLYSIYDSKISSSTSLLMFYFILVISLFSENAYLFTHLTAFLLSILITYALWRNYKKNKLNSTRNLTLSFGILAFSRIFFIMASFYSSMYVLGELIQLIGFIMLLLTFISVLKNGKKKRKT